MSPPIDDTPDAARDLGGDEFTDLIHRADLDGLVRLIDSLTVSRDWSELLRLRDRARAAVDTGRYEVEPIGITSVDGAVSVQV